MACEYADVWGTEDGCAIDPQFAFRDFFVAFWSFFEGEVVSDGGAAEGDAFEKGVFSDVGEVGVIDGAGEEVTGELGTCAVVFCAVVEKAEHGEGRFGGGFVGSVRQRAREVVSE